MLGHFLPKPRPKSHPSPSPPAWAEWGPRLSSPPSPFPTSLPLSHWLAGPPRQPPPHLLLPSDGNGRSRPFLFGARRADTPCLGVRGAPHLRWPCPTPHACRRPLPLPISLSLSPSPPHGEAATAAHVCRTSLTPSRCFVFFPLQLRWQFLGTLRINMEDPFVMQKTKDNTTSISF